MVKLTVNIKVLEYIKAHSLKKNDIIVANNNKYIIIDVINDGEFLVQSMDCERNNHLVIPTSDIICYDICVDVVLLKDIPKIYLQQLLNFENNGKSV